MTALSVLDLAPIAQGMEAGEALHNSLALARHAEQLGYRRFWLAEHHSMPGIASAATAVVIGHVAAGTERIRVGAGGIMLPNHSPLVIAEQFGTLAALFPGRIDLGLGRAPGSDATTARALRRNLLASAEEFPQDVLELLDYFEAQGPNEHGVMAVPGAGMDVPLWILGSSLFGAQLAAALGLPYAFASHFAPAQLQDAVAIYRRTFKPSKYLSKPYVMLGYNVFAADTDEAGHLLASSMQQSFISLRTGRPGKLAPPRADYFQSLSLPEQAMLSQVMACSAIGSPITVRQQMQEFIRSTEPDELIIAAMIYDHAARMRSYEIAAQVAQDL